VLSLFKLCRPLLSLAIISALLASTTPRPQEQQQTELGVVINRHPELCASYGCVVLTRRVSVAVPQPRSRTRAPCPIPVCLTRRRLKVDSGMVHLITVS
jgi:hypothetical protein